MSDVKQRITIRIDSDVIDYYRKRASKRGYQTDINRALREYMEVSRDGSYRESLAVARLHEHFDKELSEVKKLIKKFTEARKSHGATSSKV